MGFLDTLGDLGGSLVGAAKQFVDQSATQLARAGANRLTSAITGQPVVGAGPAASPAAQANQLPQVFMPPVNVPNLGFPNLQDINNAIGDFITGDATVTQQPTPMPMPSTQVGTRSGAGLFGMDRNGRTFTRSLAMVVHPGTGRPVWFRHAGRPVLFSNDKAICKRVEKTTRKFGSSTRRPR